VWFRAPERFRLDLVDHTQYPTEDVTPTDLQLVVNGSSWYSVGPSACPVGVCPRTETVVENRVPFSASTPTPTDLILPVATLADANQLEVLGEGTVLGRPAIEVLLPFEWAKLLFPFLSLGGSWRPFFAGDRVDLWLDARQIGPTLEYVKKWAPEDWPLAFIGMLHIIPQRDFTYLEDEMRRLFRKTGRPTIPKDVEQARASANPHAPTAPAPQPTAAATVAGGKPAAEGVAIAPASSGPEVQSGQ
jgi:hypothetical protein